MENINFEMGMGTDEVTLSAQKKFGTCLKKVDLGMGE